MRTPVSLLALTVALTASGCLINSNGNGGDECGPSTCREANRTQCVMEGGEPRCLCDPGFVSRPSGVCEPVSAANCADHPGDTAEPDDCQARARTLLADGKPNPRSIDPIGDLDFFRFDGKAGFIYSVAVVPEGGSLLPRVDLFDQGGVWMAAADGRPRVDMTFKTPTTAPYFLRMSHSPVDISAATGPYVVTLTDMGQDDHGDTPDDATGISTNSGSNIYGRFQYRNDEDVFEFSASSTREYQLQFEGPSGRVLPAVALYMASNLNTPVFTQQSPTVTFTVPSGGTAFLVMYMPDGSQGSYGFNFLER